ncbi:exodeoxyribonuclease VII small subunit [Patescibacteria group bacterium]|nr:exodeoxyribonuclease VII small subunit [Patescibacteria group bacterium]
MPEKKSKTTKFDVNKSFTELESITEWFESGNMDLDEGLKKYERAMELSEKLRERLEQAENKITEIQKKHNQSID